MRVLMFGWEFPPDNSGGLGTACLGLTKALVRQGTDVTFVLPFRPSSLPSFMRLLSSDLADVEFKTIYSPLTAYISAAAYQRITKRDTGGVYAPSLIEEVLRYAQQAVKLVQGEQFDVIHAHDWLSLLAALAVKKAIGKSFIAHIHATEWDRSGGNPNPDVFEIEREGLQGADHVIANSIFTKEKIVKQYGIPADRVSVVYNGFESSIFDSHGTPRAFLSDSLKSKKIALFVGRLSMHKGPDWFLQAAKLVLEKEPDSLFIVAGTGEMKYRLVELVAELGIADRVLFAGFVRGDLLAQLYSFSSVYVMPSVSEPFGIAALEAMHYGTPVIVTKQSGIAEATRHVLKVDFWDTHELASKILAAFRYAPLHETLAANGFKEAQQFTWDQAATQVAALYHRFSS